MGKTPELQNLQSICLSKATNPPMLEDGHAVDIDVWITKMVKKLTVNADHDSTELAGMTYVDGRVNGDAYLPLKARASIDAANPFATAKEMLETLRDAFGDTNRKHTAMNTFRDLRMTKDFNSFWTEFQILSSELDHNESTLVSELRHKLTPSLSRAMAGGITRPTNVNEYAEQCP